MLIDKYNKPVPRYTSYPPATSFTTDFSSDDYIEAIRLSNQRGASHLSFYLHIPFCRHLCHYCGCNSLSMADSGTIDRYITALHQEIDRITGLLDPRRRIAQIHYGGGTPTILPASELKSLNDHLLSNFACIEHPEIAIECHPGYLTEKDWQELTGAGFNRFSLGIQDFNPHVLHAVNRRQSLLSPAEIFRIIREAHGTINLDLLYGLPVQTPESFRETVEKAIALNPDRLVTFSYAHVPWVNARQRILEKKGLPSPAEKKAIFEVAHQALGEAGYQSIGLDHFVRPTDELYEALLNGRLRRNFQGYCTARTTGQVYAFGLSAISQLDGCYAQNTKDLQSYLDSIGRGIPATAKGYRLNREEQIIKEVIETLMCNYFIEWKELATRLSLSIEEIKNTIAYKEENLREFIDDGIITCEEDCLRVTSEGKLFIRNVAASLDKNYKHTANSFSKPV